MADTNLFFNSTPIAGTPTPLFFGGNDPSTPIFSSVIILGQTGVITPTITTSSFPITGNTATGQLVSFPLVGYVNALTGSVSTTAVGTIATSSTSTFAITGNGLTTSVGSTSGAQSFFRSISSIGFTPPGANIISGDAYWNNVWLLMRGNAADGTAYAVNEADTSTNLTVVGNTKITTADSKFGGSSILFDTSSRIEPGLIDLNTDFTLEGWASPAYNGTLLGRHTGSSGYLASLDRQSTTTARLIYQQWGPANGYAFQEFSCVVTTVSSTNWVHYAIVRAGNTIKFFIDGILKSNVSGPYGFNTATGYPGIPSNTWINGDPDSSSMGSGGLDEYRLTLGTARYSANFTLPTVPYSNNDPYLSDVVLMLHGDGANNSTIIKNYGNKKISRYTSGASISTNQSKFGGSSLKSNGSTGSCFVIPPSQGPVLGLGDFTMETWYYTADNSYNPIITNRYEQDGATGCFAWYFDTGSGMSFHELTRSPDKNVACTFTFSTNTWYHLAVTRTSGIFRMFVNGVQLVADTLRLSGNPVTCDFTLQPYYTSFGGLIQYQQSLCYMDDVRITIGVSRYTGGDFSVPGTEPQLFSGTGSDPYWLNVNTQLSFDSNYTDDSLSAKTITPNSTIISATQSKFGGTSLNTNYSYISIPNADNAWDFTSASVYTLDYWIYLLDASTDTQWIGSGYGTFTMGIASGKIQISKPLIATVITGTTTINTNQWYHIAVAQDNESIRLYVDGVLNGTTAPTTFQPSGSAINVGGNPTYSLSSNMYIDDFRLTTGVSRYLDLDIKTSINSVFLGNQTQLSNMSLNTAIGIITTQQTPSAIIGQTGFLTAQQALNRALNGVQTVVNLGTYNIGTEIFPAGVFSTGQVGTVTVGANSYFVTGVSSAGQRGTILAKSDLTRALTGNQFNGATGYVIGSLQVNLTGNGSFFAINSMQLQANISNAAVGTVGNITVTSNYTRAITSVLGVGLPGGFYQLFLTPLTGVELTRNVGNITTSLTQNYATANVSVTGIGSLVSTNTQVKALNSQSYRSLTTLYAGTISPTNTTLLTGVSNTNDVGSFTTSVTENFAAGISSTLAVGTIRLQNDGLLALFGSSMLGYTGILISTKFANLTGNQSSIVPGFINTRQSIGVKADCRVGSVVTSQDCVTLLNSSQSNTGIGSVRNYKYSPLTGIESTLSSNSLVDTHSYGVRAVCQINAMDFFVLKSEYPSGNHSTGQTGVVFATQTVALVGTTFNGLINNYADVQHSLGVQSISSVGSVKFVRSFSLIGNERNTSVGNVGFRQDYMRTLVGNSSTGKLYKALEPDVIELGEHHEVEIPRGYSLTLEGEFSFIQSFECINCSSPVIEVYHRDNRAWIRLNTPGSFEDSKLYYVDQKGNYGEALFYKDVPADNDIYKIEANKVLRLEFEMKGIYDDGGPLIPITRTYLINIVVDHSFDRDLVGSGTIT
jgi:hypothetical protein